jgi:hypothetical protein
MISRNDDTTGVLIMNYVDWITCAIWSGMGILNVTKTEWKFLWKIKSIKFSSIKWVRPVFGDLYTDLGLHSSFVLLWFCVRGCRHRQNNEHYIWPFAQPNLCTSSSSRVKTNPPTLHQLLPTTVQPAQLSLLSALKIWFYHSSPVVSSNLTANLQRQWHVGLKKVF